MPLSPEGALIQGAGSGVWGAMYYGIIPVGGASLAELLALADSWYSSKDGGVIQERPSRITATDLATFGSTTAVDTNDPLRLKVETEPYVWFPNAGALQIDYIQKSIPSQSGVGEMTAVCDAEISTNWNDASQRRLMALENGVYSFGLITGIGGQVRLYGSSVSITSVGHPTYGRVQWRCRRNGTSSASIAWRTDGVTDPDAAGWTVSADGPLSDGTTTFDRCRIGDTVSGNYWEGKVFYAGVYDDGGLVDEMVPTDLSTWTISRTVVGAKTAIVDYDKYIYLPGIEGANVSVKAASEPDLNCDKLEIVCDFGPDGFDHRTGNVYVCPGGIKLSGSAAYPGMYMYSSSAGQGRLFGADGTSTFDFTTGSYDIRGHRYIKCVAEAGVGGDLLTSDDGVSWTSRGSQSVPGFATLVSSSVPMRLGGVPYGSGSSPYGGRMDYLKVYQDDVLTHEISAPLDYDTQEINNVGGAGLKATAVTRSVDMLDGTDDYISFPASDTPTFTATTGKFTVIMAYRQPWATWVSWDRLWSAESAYNKGTNFSGHPTLTATYFQVGGTLATISQNVSVPTGAVQVIAGVVDNGTMYGYSNDNGMYAGKDITGVGVITFGDPYCGKYAGFTDKIPAIEVFEVVHMPGVALTEAELDAIAELMIAGTYT